jgi:hypothetical protein
MNKLFLISAGVSVVFGFLAYNEHINYDPAAEARARRVVEQNIVRSVASEAMDEQRRCLANNPSEWCNRDMSYRDHLRAAQAASRKTEGVYNVVDHRTDRNAYALISLIAGLIALSQLRRKA